MSEKREGFSKYLGLTFLIGFGFFTMGLMDPLYDTYVPKFLGDHISSKTIIGIIMALDNALAVFLIPIVSIWSDKTRTRIGRRMPWILATLPVCAILFAFVPYARPFLWGLIVLLFFLNIFKQAARGPIVALMPDLTPAEYRSEANGVINTMGGLAAILGTLILGKLMDFDKVLPVIGQTKGKLPFPVATVFILVSTILVFALIRENKLAAAVGNDPEKKPVPFKEAVKAAIKGSRGALLILVSLFLWFIGYEGVKPFIGVYAMDVIGVSDGSAGFGMGAVGVAYALFAVPSGYLAHKIGRKKTIRISLFALVIVCLFLLAFDFTLRGGLIPAGIAFPVYLGILFVFGIFWVSVVANSFPMLWQMAGQDTMGIYTGVYYTASQSAAIAAPPIAGAIIDLIVKFSPIKTVSTEGKPIGGYWGMFVLCAVAMAAAFVVMGFVKGGEPEASQRS